MRKQGIVSMQQKKPTVEMRGAFINLCSKLNLSASTAKKITSTFTNSEDSWEAKEALAAKWVSVLSSCENEEEVLEFLKTNTVTPVDGQ